MLWLTIAMTTSNADNAVLPVSDSHSPASMSALADTDITLDLNKINTTGYFSNAGEFNRITAGLHNSASTNLYSLVETTKANGLEPYGYLKHVFSELPKAACVEDIEALQTHSNPKLNWNRRHEPART